MDGGHEEDENDEDIDDLVQLPQSQPANSKTSKTVPAETKPASLNGDFIILKKYRIIVYLFLSYRKFINFSSEEKVVEQKEQYF